MANLNKAINFWKYDFSKLHKNSDVLYEYDGLLLKLATFRLKFMHAFETKDIDLFNSLISNKYSTKWHNSFITSLKKRY